MSIPSDKPTTPGRADDIMEVTGEDALGKESVSSHDLSIQGDEREGESCPEAGSKDYLPHIEILGKPVLLQLESQLSSVDSLSMSSPNVADAQVEEKLH